MDEDTKNLLTECSKGCKMAITSIDQLQDYIKNEKLNTVIAEYRRKHEELDGECSKLLKEFGEGEKEPGAFAAAFSWITTEVKMLLRDDDNKECAKIMMNGCNMGIQSLCKYQHQYSGASQESKKLSEKIVKVDETFMKELEQFL